MKLEMYRSSDSTGLEPRFFRKDSPVCQAAPLLIHFARSRNFMNLFNVTIFSYTETFMFCNIGLKKYEVGLLTPPDLVFRVSEGKIVC